MVIVMYEPERYLTMQIASEVLSEFEWPTAFKLEDRLPDGIAMAFPRCTVVLSEGFESEMMLRFLPGDTGLKETVTLRHILVALKSVHGREGLPPVPALINDCSPLASLDKVKNGIRDLSMLLLTYLRPCLLGDFSWVEMYRTFKRRTTIRHPS